jgi:glycosidase
MKVLLSLSLAIWLHMIPVLSSAQLVTTDPAIPLAGESVTIYFDATQGSGGLEGYNGDVYAHTGVLTNLSTGSGDWKYVMSDWGVNTEATKMTRVSPDYYSLELGPSIRDYYGVPLAETITHMAFVFRSSDSQLEGKGDGGSDIFVEVYPEGLSIVVVNPDRYSFVDPGGSIHFEAAASRVANLVLYLNNAQVKAVNDESISHSFDFSSPGDYWIKVTAEDDGETVADSVFVHVLGSRPGGPVPGGLRDGINYTGEQTATLVFYAPMKEDVFVIGDFNTWTPNSASRMIKDGDRFWITLDMLTPGEIYGFQYLVDGELLIADPYTNMTLDPDDKWIDASTYPGLKSYPEGLTTGITSVLQTGQEPYEWKNTAFTSPEPQNLVIYELLLRDFLAAHDWKTLTDTLDYFTELGVNAIELMPVSEFEGNESWGYNPSFYFAADKYYGPAGDLKVFIDSCHGRGIAVILDMVLNHSYGESPLVKLYFDEASGKVTADNPWYNVESPNPVFSWGYDFDHQSPATQDFVDSVNHYWLSEFHVDGFRFDFTKGFTNTPGDGGGYDLSRINILKRMASRIREVKEDTYVILEHFAANAEEFALSEEGMMLWGNLNYPYNQGTMGYAEDSDFSQISYKERFWNQPMLVGYMESHDEERLMYKNMEFGASSGSYNIQERDIALERMELAGVFFFTVPGPKMIWQFGELGYDFSIDYDCRVCNKPIRWDYYKTGVRLRIYQLWSALIQLKLQEPAFSSDDFELYLSDAAKRIEINHEDMDLRIIGNFDVETLSVHPAFSKSGWWYSYFEGDSTNVSDLQAPVSLNPGEYRIYTSKRLGKPDITAGFDRQDFAGSSFHVYPNPVSGMLYLEPLPEKSRLTIISNSGQLVSILDMERNQDQLDLSFLPPGLYVLSRQSGKEAPQYVKVIRE